MNDELFFAWLDGELDRTASAEVEAQVAADPGLQRKAAAHRSMQVQLNRAFEPVTAAPVPAVVSDSPTTGQVIDMAAARSRRPSRPAFPAAAQWAAMAATLVLGLVGGSILGGGPSTPARGGSDYFVASAQLGEALDSRLASAPVASGPQIGLTFRDRAGSICRSFTDGGAQGLACRDGASWRIRGLVQGADQSGGEFRMAAGADPALAALIDSTIEGEAFDAAAERKALSGGWR